MEVGGIVGGQKASIVADAVVVAGPGHVGSDMMARVEEMMEKLKTKNLSLHGELDAEWTAHTRILMDNIRF